MVKLRKKIIRQFTFFDVCIFFLFLCYVFTIMTSDSIEGRKEAVNLNKISWPSAISVQQGTLLSGSI